MNKVYALASVVVLLLIETLRILAATDGSFIYTLDDPYIHLALAENILHGSYGVNPGEVSAPSSSILWPFLMAAVGAWEFAPLLINIVAALATTWLLARITEEVTDSTRMQWILVMLLVICSNVVGLVFTGMEHSLQVLATVAIAWGLWRTSRDERVGWLPVVIIVAPLIRYELLAIAVPAILLLWWWGQRMTAVVATLGIGAGVGGFSFFLLGMGMHALPTSVHVKSAIVESNGAVQQLLFTLRENLKQRQSVVLLTAAAMAIVRPQRGLWFAVAGAVGLHMMVGQFGWFYRYEAYIMAFAGVLVILMYADILRSLSAAPRRWTIALGALVVLLAAGAPYVQGLAHVQGASANIYLQQYQMHRFVTGWWKDDVAVNDIGWVSYHNDHHVLDLWGLSSRTALELRSQHRNDTTHAWMDQLVQEQRIGLVMLYEDWFGGVPEQWTLVGAMHMDRARVTSTRDSISFYATRPDVIPEIHASMRAFRTALPDGARITLQPEVVQ